MTKILLIAVILGMAFWLYRKFQSDQRKAKLVRLSLFTEATDLLAHPEMQQDGLGFPVVTGTYQDYEVKLTLIEDSLAVRKIPPLWLTVTVQGKQAIKGSLDLIVRPQNNEFYSPAWKWQGNLQVPSHWPQHSIIKYQDEPVDVGLIDTEVPKIFADEHMKELLIAPWAVRLTYMAKQAERGEYLIMRNAIFNGESIPKAVVEKILKQAIHIRQLLEKGAK